MLTILCPECNRSIEFDSEPKIGQQTTCQSCENQFVVTWLYPISLDTPEINDHIEADVEK